MESSFIVLGPSNLVQGFQNPSGASAKAFLVMLVQILVEQGRVVVVQQRIADVVETLLADLVHLCVSLPILVL